jgi:hypothetical protein
MILRLSTFAHPASVLLSSKFSVQSSMFDVRLCLRLSILFALARPVFVLLSSKFNVQSSMFEVRFRS